MKRLSALLLTALLATPALAQIRITRPATPPATTTTTAPDLTDVPAGYRVVSGRIRAARDVRLPAGSTVTVSLEDDSPSASRRRSLLEIGFSTPRLSAPYQMQFNPVRLNARRTYVVVARVYGPDGRLLYSGAANQSLPEGRNVVVNVLVTPVR